MTGKQKAIWDTLRTLANDVQFGLYGTGDRMDAAMFWAAVDEAQDAMTAELPDPNAE